MGMKDRTATTVEEYLDYKKRFNNWGRWGETDQLGTLNHIDSTAMCLKPGLVLLNSTRVNDKNCPKIFANWDKIYFEDVAPTSEAELKFQKEFRDPLGNEIEALGFQTNLHDMSSPWVGMNFLPVDQETVIVDERQTNLIKLLEKHRVFFWLTHYSLHHNEVIPYIL